MVSFQAPITLNCTNKVSEHVDQSLSNKRMTVDHNYAEEQEVRLIKKPKPALNLHSTGLESRFESQLETPLPLDWQQCLDIQSGKLHFYNTRTEIRTSRDPRDGSGSLEAPRGTPPCHMRLDLELNLPCKDYPDPKLHTDLNSMSKDWESNFGTSNEKNKKINVSRKTSSAPSWLAFEGDEKSEMVATVCKRCFMLVMLCKASPACPNCKFMHSPDHSTPYLFKRSWTQLLY